MEPNLTECSIVINASTHNPGMVSRDWLFSNIIDFNIDEENEVKFINSSEVSVYETADFNVQVIPEQIVFETQNVDEENLNKILQMARNYIDNREELIYDAIGINFEWKSEGEDLPTVSVKLGERDPFEEIEGENLSADFKLSVKNDDYKLKLDLDIPENNTRRYTFNFHKRVDSDGTEPIMSHIDRFQELKSESENIINNIVC